MLEDPVLAISKVARAVRGSLAYEALTLGHRPHSPGHSDETRTPRLHRGHEVTMQGPVGMLLVGPSCRDHDRAAEIMGW